MNWKPSRKLLAIALIALVALPACTSSRRVATTDVRWKMEEVRSDTMKEQVVVTVVDTIKETTTITLVLRQAKEPSEPDDTVRMTTVTDRTRSRDCSQLRVKSEKLKVETDTVYVERTADTTLIVGSTRNPPKDSPGRNIRQSLMCIFFIISAIIILIIIIKIFK